VRHGKSEARIRSFRASTPGSSMSSVSPAVPVSDVGSLSVRLVAATFWQRLAAGLIDFVLTGLVVFSLGKLCSTSKSAAEVLVVPLAL
jgi:predicted anti-sigma-YlaC factor YlaD